MDIEYLDWWSKYFASKKQSINYEEELNENSKINANFGDKSDIDTEMDDEKPLKKKKRKEKRKRNKKKGIKRAFTKIYNYII